MTWQLFCKQTYCLQRIYSIITSYGSLPDILDLIRQKQSSYQRFLNWYLDSYSFQVVREVELTHKEYLLLTELGRNAGRVLPYQMLLSSVWRPEYWSDTEHLNSYIRQLRNKVETDPMNPKAHSYQVRCGILSSRNETRKIPGARLLKIVYCVVLRIENRVKYQRIKQGISICFLQIPDRNPLKPLQSYCF